jgi:hypothetical protein
MLTHSPTTALRWPGHRECFVSPLPGALRAANRKTRITCRKNKNRSLALASLTFPLSNPQPTPYRRPLQAHTWIGKYSDGAVRRGGAAPIHCGIIGVRQQVRRGQRAAVVSCASALSRRRTVRGPLAHARSRCTADPPSTLRSCRRPPAPRSCRRARHGTVRALRRCFRPGG